MQNNNAGKPPASPSWKFLRNNRSTSMPIQRTRRGSSYSQGGGGGGRLTLWAQSILAGVGVTSSPEKNPALTTLSERRRMVSDRHFQVPPHGNLSFSTFNKVEKSPPQDSLPANVRVGIVLVHLKEQLPKYCRLLQEPTFANSQEACQAFTKAIARSLPTSANGGSPKTTTGSGSSPHSPSSPRSTPSPSRSPLRSLFGRGGAADSSPPSTHHRSLLMDSSLALEREWERYTMPLQLLAAAEALYANLHHAHHHDHSGYVQSQLEGLYRWLLDDLTLVKETLCDSVIGTTPATPNDLRLLFLQETAQQIAPILLVLVSLAKQRCRMIQYQSTLWETGGRKQFGLMAEAMDNMGKNWANEWSLLNIDNSVANGLVESLSNELAIWKHLLETASYLEKCRFTESILSIRKTKARLNPSSKLKMEQWFWKTLKQMIASSYLYFDRVKSFAKPLYGFHNGAFVDTENSNKSRMGGSPHALDDRVLDFLHKQQKSGTADVAVTIVHDAVQTSNLHMERGFTLLESPSPTEEDESKYSEEETTRLHWPAVYMRTTKYHGEAQVGAGLLGGKRRNPSRRSLEDGNSSSFSEHYKRWGSKDGSSPAKSANESSNEVAIQRTTLEYAPNHGSVSWPHTEWESVIGLITGSGDLPSTARLVSNLEMSTVTEEKGFFAFLGQTASTSNTQKNKEIQMECVVRRANNGRSAFWMAELSEFSWLVVMTKAEEESRWHRRRGSRFDDVEEFVQHLVSSLRVENCFQTLPTEDSKKCSLEKDLLRGMQGVNGWNEKSAEDFSRSVKYAFGLSSTRPKGDAYHNRRFLIGNISPSLSILPTTEPPMPQLAIDDSAMAFFLGPDIMLDYVE